MLFYDRHGNARPLPNAQQKSPTSAATVFCCVTRPAEEGRRRGADLSEFLGITMAANLVPVLTGTDGTVSS